MAAAPVKKKRSPKQAAAAKAWAAAGRASQKAKRAQAIAKTGKPPPRTKAQKAATQAWQRAGAQASHARSVAAKSGKPYVAPKAAKAPLELNDSGLHSLPVCAAVAVAEHLLAFTGTFATDSEILSLAKDSDGAAIGDLLEWLQLKPFCGHRLALARMVDPQLIVPGLICGLETGNGYHSVVSLRQGALSWGMAMPWPGAPAEAWHLEWEA